MVALASAAAANAEDAAKSKISSVILSDYIRLLTCFDFADNLFN
jgi:hypothetical protein